MPEGNWAVFTCRSEEYQNSPKLGLPEVRVQSLDTDRMHQYFKQRLGERADDYWRDFEKRLRGVDDRFEQLARNPFMLAQLVEQCAEGKSLADHRAMLMHELAGRLLSRELESSENRQPDELTRDPQKTFRAAMDALSRFAFAARASGAGTTLTETQAAQVQLSDSGFRREQLIKFALDASVLERAEISAKGITEPGYAFYHELLQEYFAANELVRRFRAGANLAQYVRVQWRHGLDTKLFRSKDALGPPQTTNWDETAIFAAALAGTEVKRFIVAVQKENLPLAGRCLAEIGADRFDRGFAGELRAELLMRQHTRAAPFRARIAAGLALGELGHPELLPRQFDFEGRQVWAIRPPLQPVREGEFIRGSERGKSKYSDEFTTERRINLPAFSIGRYPVTNAEFKFFIDDNGYKTDRWWSEGGREWKKGGPDAHKDAIEDWLRTRSIVQGFKDADQSMADVGLSQRSIQYWKEIAALSDEEAQARARQVFERPFDRPAFWDDRDLASPGKPVVGVNWFEADAYCRWLAAMTGIEFRLPDELEWEKAARGTDGREFPWGEKFDSALCNTNKSYIETTTPVGLYPGGVSPFGLFDASGNVWEWTSSWYEKYPGGDDDDSFGEKFRVVRGGAWDLDRVLARCASRNRGTPGDFYNLIGFRVFSPRLYS